MLRLCILLLAAPWVVAEATTFHTCFTDYESFGTHFPPVIVDALVSLNHSVVATATATHPPPILTVIISTEAKLSSGGVVQFGLESYAFRGNGSHMDIYAGGARGLLYALLCLRDLLVQCDLPLAILQHSPFVDRRPDCALPHISHVESPRFPRRQWSEQGQMLDFPERSYWSDVAPFVNTSRVEHDIAVLSALLPTLHSLRLNAFSWQFSGIEDFIDWDRLPSRGGPIYGPTDPHRARSAVLTQLVDAFLSTAAATLVDTYAMFIEFLHPPVLAERYNITSVYSADLPIVLRARFDELFVRLPHLTGVVIYCADSWSPRAGYAFKQLWSTPEEFAHLGKLYYDAVVVAAGKELIFDLWVPVSPLPGNAWKFFNATLPPHITISVNDGQGDFVLANKANQLLLDGAARDRSLIVAFDIFRQYDGWGRTISAPFATWQTRLRVAARTGAVGISLYASWGPQNTWPDCGPELINVTDPAVYKLWVGRWNKYRIYDGVVNGRAYFSPMRASAFVMSALLWNPEADVTHLLAQWAQMPPLSRTLSEGQLLASSFTQSDNGWRELYLEGVDEYAYSWSMVFTPKDGPNAESAGCGLQSLFVNASLSQLRASRFRGLQVALSVADTLQHVCNVSESRSARATTLHGYSDAVIQQACLDVLRAADVSLRYLTLIFNFREVVWLNHSITRSVHVLPEQVAEIHSVSDPIVVYRMEDLCTLFAGGLSALAVDIDSFQGLYPEESTSWQIGAPDPNLDVRPNFFRLHQRSMSDWLPLLRNQWSRYCPHRGRY